MSVFTPDLMIKDVTRIDKTLLDAKGIKGLILDVDNTLTQYGSQEIQLEILSWIQKMQASGIKLMIASNNTRKRVAPFAKMLGLDFVPWSLKPLCRGFRKCRKTFGLYKNEIAIVGDQIYTDVLGGNLYGIYTIMVIPFMAENNLLFRMRSWLERVHINAYRKRREAMKNENEIWPGR